MSSFFKSFFIFIASIALVMVVLSKTAASFYIDSATWGILGYFTLLTAAFHYGLMKSSKGNPQQFVRYYMGAKSFKLLFHLVIIIIFCLFHRSEAVRFIISFAIFYFVFTVFEFTAVKRSFKK